MGRKKNYLNNGDLHNEIIKSQAEGKLTREAEKMLILLAEKAITKLPYVYSADRKDCLQTAIFDLLKYWKGYKPIHKNAFAYYTEIAKKGYAKGWNKLYPKKYHGTISISGSGSDDSDTDGIYTI